MGLFYILNRKRSGYEVTDVVEEELRVNGTGTGNP